MRWPWIVGALGIAFVAPNAPKLAVANQAVSLSLPPTDEELPAELDPTVLEPVMEEGRKAPPLAEIDAEVLPNEFTDDPVLGRSERVVGEGVKGMIAFTFDDGPVPETTPAVLAALAKYDIPASFFLVTRHFRHPKPHYRDRAHELLAEEVAAGHLVGSHGVMHERLLTATKTTLDREITGSVKELSSYAKQPIGMFRPPFGKINYMGRRLLKSLGLTEVFWSIDPRDWEADPGDEQYMRQEINFAIRNAGGGVIVLHDSKPVTASIIAGVFDDLEVWNCKRLAKQQDPIYPVSLHYFLRDDIDKARPIPPAVEKRTAAYKQALPTRCTEREAARKQRLAKPARK